MSKKLKAVESSVQPNHKEVELWITPTNNDGSKEVKYWNSKAQQWSKCEGEGNGGDVEAAAEYYRIDWDKAFELGYDIADKSNLTFTGEFNYYIKSNKYIKQSMFEGQYIYILPAGLAGILSDITYVTHIAFAPIKLLTKAENEIISKEVISFKQNNTNYPEIFDCFVPCTKEEFYALT